MVADRLAAYHNRHGDMLLALSTLMTLNPQKRGFGEFLLQRTF